MQDPHKMLKIEIREFFTKNPRKSATLKCFWNQFKTVHLQGSAHLEDVYLKT